MSIKLQGKVFCLHCRKETLHTLTYAGGYSKGESYLKRIKCEECGTSLEIDRKIILEHYAGHALERIFTKPHRLTGEIRKGLTRFIKSLPIRIITKPYRIGKEIMEIVKKEPSK